MNGKDGLDCMWENFRKKVTSEGNLTGRERMSCTDGSDGNLVSRSVSSLLSLFGSTRVRFCKFGDVLMFSSSDEDDGMSERLSYGSSTYLMSGEENEMFKALTDDETVP